MPNLLLRLCQTAILGIKRPEKRVTRVVHILYSFKSAEEKVALDFCIFVAVAAMDGVFTN